jgi:nicotinate-nucleotide adenylyltransferase
MTISYDLPPVKKNVSIGLFGGSFDPPHLGHTMLALSFLALEAIDELWVIPCAEHSEKIENAPFAHRLTMAEKAFKRINACRVIDIESQLASPSFTIDTVRTLKTLRPDLRFSLAIGSDLAKTFPTWRHATELVNELSIIVFSRSQHSLLSLPPLLKHASFHKDLQLIDVTSSRLRQSLQRRNEQENPCVIDRDVLAYIREKELYGQKQS